MKNKKFKILFFIGTLSSGGKERRLIELLTFFSKNERYSLFLVSKKEKTRYKNFYELNVEWITLNSDKTQLKTFFEFYTIAKKIKPDIIHTWGRVQTTVVLPYIIFNSNVKLVNSQITSAPPKVSALEKKINAINFYFSDSILSNSEAGIKAYNPPKDKSFVIYNGMNLSRFKDLTDPRLIKEKFKMGCKYSLIMVATYSQNKDHQKFFRVGMALNKIRKDTMFIGIGFYDEKDPHLFTECLDLVKNHPNLRPLTGTSNVESLVNVCDIGLLFSNTKVHGEGISNSIIEYMALGKPVIANDAGGTKEVVVDGKNGYLIQDETDDQIAMMIDELLNNPEKMKKMGDWSRRKIIEDFSLARMGKEFENVYKDLL